MWTGRSIDQMPTSAERRKQKRAEAAQVLEAHSGPVMAMLVEVVADLADEVEGMKQFQADAAMAAELAYRLDTAVPFGDPLLEALDGIIAFFVALAAIGIYRGIRRAEKLRAAKLKRLRKKLDKPGSNDIARARIERKIKRLEATEP